MRTPVLQYIEHRSLSKCKDFTLNWYDVPNLPVTTAKIKILLCPSSPNPERLDGRFFFSSRRRHTRFDCDWSSDVCSSDLAGLGPWAGFVAGWLYWYFWIIVVPVEAIAGANILHGWLGLPSWLLGLVLMGVMRSEERSCRERV